MNDEQIMGLLRVMTLTLAQLAVVLVLLDVVWIIGCGNITDFYLTATGVFIALLMVLTALSSLWDDLDG